LVVFEGSAQRIHALPDSFGNGSHRVWGPDGLLGSLGALFAFKLTNALATVLNGLRCHHASTLVFQFTTEVSHHTLGGFKHELEGLQRIGGPWQAHEETDTGGAEPGHVLDRKSVGWG